MEICERRKALKLVYAKPILKDLTVGSRIAFLRQMRRVSRRDLALKIGLSEENAKRIMSRYERAKILPENDKLQKISNILDVNIKMLMEYNLEDPEDLYHLMLWIEELCPNFTLTRTEVVEPENKTQEVLSKMYYRWHEMKRKYRNNEITYEEYWEWKLK